MTAAVRMEIPSRAWKFPWDSMRCRKEKNLYADGAEEKGEG